MGLRAGERVVRGEGVAAPDHAPDGGVAALSGLLVLHHRRAGGGDEYWTGAELVYVLVLFLSLFYGIYSFFGWFFYA